MKVKISEIKVLMERILVSRGLPKKDAEVVVEDYLLGEKEGKKTHGLLMFPSLVEKMKDWKLGKIIIEKEGTSYALINGNENLGQLVGRKAREIVIKKARKNGIAMVGVYNTVAFLRPGSQAEKIQEKGLIGIVVNNGGWEAVAPTGSIDPVLGTNPIGIGVPAKKPIIADFAAAKRAWGEVRAALATGKSIPENTYLDKDGNFTTDPEKANSVLPFGDYKGYIMALLVEILTGSLVKMPMGIKPRNKDYRNLRGALFIAIDPSKFTDFNAFTKSNSELAKQIKSSRKAEDVDEILIPGERAAKNKARAEKLGIFEIDEKLYRRIKELEN